MKTSKRSFRFKVTSETSKSVQFVYGDDAMQAVGRLRGLIPGSYSVEPAGHVKDGVLHIPPYELTTVMASLAGRDAPVK